LKTQGDFLAFEAPQKHMISTGTERPHLRLHVDHLDATVMELLGK
jgi:hypothetical protein